MSNTNQELLDTSFEELYGNLMAKGVSKEDILKAFSPLQLAIIETSISNHPSVLYLVQENERLYAELEAEKEKVEKLSKLVQKSHGTAAVKQMLEEVPVLLPGSKLAAIRTAALQYIQSTANMGTAARKNERTGELIVNLADPSLAPLLPEGVSVVNLYKAAKATKKTRTPRLEHREFMGWRQHYAHSIIID